MSSYDESHWKAAKGVLRYLKGTMDFGLTYDSSSSRRVDLTGYTDSDYAGDIITRKSTSGYVFMLNGSPISWSSQKQPCIAQSSTEAEYISLATAGKEGVWLRKFLQELKCPQPCTPILVDNQSAIKIAKNPEMHSRIKHIDVRYHFIRELVANGEVDVRYVNTTEQAADGLTKALTPWKIRRKSLPPWNSTLNTDKMKGKY